jgi:c-di-GMP-binding flagellar brake protein YcgR
LFSVRTLDLSHGGIAIVAPINLPEGTTLELHCQLPLKPTGSAAFHATARVANSFLSGKEDGFQIGLSFVHIDDASRQTLGSYLK